MDATLSAGPRLCSSKEKQNRPDAISPLVPLVLGTRFPLGGGEQDEKREGRGGDVFTASVCLSVTPD